MDCLSGSQHAFWLKEKIIKNQQKTTMYLFFHFYKIVSKEHLQKKQKPKVF